LSKKILFEQIKDANVMCLIADDTKEITFASTKKQTAQVGDDGIIEVENTDSP
jgi:hypothetical protein